MAVQEMMEPLPSPSQYLKCECELCQEEVGVDVMSVGSVLQLEENIFIHESSKYFTQF